MKFSELNIEVDKSFNIFILVIVAFISLLTINIFFYQVKDHIDYFELTANSILLFTTFYLIYVTQKNSTNKSGFYYYTSIGFAFVFFGLLILTLDYLYVYSQEVVEISVKLLFVFGYTLLAIGVTKWVKYNESRQDELALQANTDELTGILNRRSFTGFVNHEFVNARKNSMPFSLVIIDIDFFKLVNDEYGHLVGDEVLKNLAGLMSGSFRAADKVCRWGGEEFAILLPNTSLTNAINVAEKFRKKVQEQNFYHEHHTIKYTISSGVSEFLCSDKSVDNLIKRADQALYKAKDNNRNCVQSIRA